MSTDFDYQKAGRERAGMPTWAKVLFALVGVLVVLFVAMLLIGGGKHGGGPLNHGAPGQQSSPGSSVGGAPNAAAIAKYVDCLRDHGATIDESELPNGHPTSDFFERLANPDPALKQAKADCADLAPM